MILSLLVYTIVAILLYALAKNLATRDAYVIRYTGRPTPILSIELILSIAVFAFITGARFDVGVDHGTYMKFYLDVQTNGWIERTDLEGGFLSIMRVFAESGLHYSFFFALWGSIQLFFIYYSLKDYKQVIPYVALILMLSPYFLEWMNGIRQATVCCVFVAMSHFIVTKKPLSYICVVLLMSIIHKSSLLLLPLYFIGQCNMSFKNSYINIAILLICTLVGESGVLEGVFSNSGYIFKSLGYETYAENIENIVEDTREMSWGPIRILLYARDVFIICIFPQLIRFYKKDKWIKLVFNFFFIGACLYNLLVYNGVIFTRPLMYFRIFGLIISSFTFYYLVKTKNQIKLCLFCLCSITYIYISHIKLYLTGVVNSPEIYKFFFLK